MPGGLRAHPDHLPGRRGHSLCHAGLCFCATVTPCLGDLLTLHDASWPESESAGRGRPPPKVFPPRRAHVAPMACAGLMSACHVWGAVLGEGDADGLGNSLQAWGPPAQRGPADLACSVEGPAVRTTRLSPRSHGTGVNLPQATQILLCAAEAAPEWGGSSRVKVHASTTSRGASGT